MHLNLKEVMPCVNLYIFHTKLIPSVLQALKLEFKLLQKLKKVRNDAYKNSKICKEKTKAF